MEQGRAVPATGHDGALESEPTKDEVINGRRLESTDCGAAPVPRVSRTVRQFTLKRVKCEIAAHRAA